ncbi:MAG: hypothetical protein HQL28_01405, partial [Candidatus Omnitrophica bacterium]|nr:hypothetical protein [Candidatus Omnitrophota bacterium]
PNDIRPSDGLLLAKALQLADDGLILANDSDDAKKRGEKIIFSKTVKRLLEANYILKYLNSRVDFDNAGEKALIDMVDRYKKNMSRKEYGLFVKSRDLTAREEFRKDAAAELAKVIARTKYVLENIGLLPTDRQFILDICARLEKDFIISEKQPPSIRS